jgi:hypothetical protein
MRRFLKAVVPPLVIGLFLSLLAGFAYFSQNPDSLYLEKAADWPVVGLVAQRFREAYLGTGDDGSAATTESASDATGADREEGHGETVVVVRLGADGKPLTEKQLSGEEPIWIPSGTDARNKSGKAPDEAVGASASEKPTGSTLPDILVEDSRSSRRPPRPTRETLDPSASQAASVAARERLSYLVQEWTWFLPGQTIRTEPRAEAPTRFELDSLAWLPVIGGQGSWAQVVYDGQRSWIDTSWQPPHPRKGARRGLLRHRYEPVRSSDWGDLVRARKILDLKKPTRKLGAYDLLTDVDDEELLDFLDRAAIAAEEAYFARFGRLPSGDPGRTVVLFARRDDYRRYAGDSPVARHQGHARTGLLTFYAEGRSREELGRTLIHEIGHLLNDRALAWRLPPWLEEGLATDLGSVWVEGSDLVRDPRRDSHDFVLQGPDARLLYLGEVLKGKGLPPLAALMSLDYDTFHQQGQIESWAYAESVALVRYLLDGDDGRHAEAFLEFLKEIAGGYGADPRMLLKLLDLDLEELERGFRSWLNQEIQTARLRLDQRARKVAAR